MTQLYSLRDDTRAFLDRRHGHYIDGCRVEPASGEWVVSLNPATEEALSDVARGNSVDVDRAVKAADRAFKDKRWTGLTDDQRASILFRAAQLIEDNGEQLAELETLDNGKPYGAALYGEIAMSARAFRYYAGWIGKINGETFAPSVPGKYHGYTRKEPIGVVAAITPWNGPLVMAAWKLAPALAAGCSAVIKPSEQTSLTTLRLAELLSEAGLPDGILNVVTGTGEEVGRCLSEHSLVKKIAFTGSTRVGKGLVQSASQDLKHLSLELGGKSPVLIFEDANIDKAIAGAADAIFANSGQVCVAGSRLYVHESIHDRVVKGVCEIARSLKIGHGLDPQTQMGPLISEAHLNSVLNYVQKGKAEGARLVQGGVRIEGDGYYMEPAVFTHTGPGMCIHDEEIFGPVLSIASFKTEEEVIGLANQSNYGLASSVWTQDMAKLHRCIEALEAGIVWGNIHGLPDMAMPIGGMKQSGWGRENARQGMELYQQTKTILIDVG